MNEVQGGAGGPGAPKPKGGNPMKITCVVLGLVLGCGGIGVVGLLAALAIPNFLKFQCKSKQSEVRANLMGLRIAEEAFFAEHGFYTSDLVALGWTPSGAPQYVYGFAYVGPENVTTGPSDHDIERSDTLHEDVIAKGGYSTEKMVRIDGGKLYPEDLPEDSYVERTDYVAAAVGDLSADPSGTLDIWTLGVDGQVTNIQSDCP